MPDKTGSELLTAAQRVVKGIGTTHEPTVPKVNDPKSAALLEYAVSVAVLNAAKRRAEAARTVVLERMREYLPTQVSPREASYQDTTAVLTTQRVAGHRKLSKQRMISTLVEKFGMKVKDAEETVNSACTTDPESLRLEVILRHTAP